MIIYKWTNKKNGKIYIGQTTMPLEHRQRMHVNTTNAGSDLPIHNAIRKYGLDGFTIEAIAFATDLDELNVLEKTLIKQYDCKVPKGYNLKDGGDNHTWHPESKKKASNSAKKRMEADGGEQHKTALILAQKARKGKTPWNKGKKATEEAKHNQSLAHIGQIAWNKRAIICIETGQEFESLHAAAKALQLQPGHICSVLKQKRKSTGGYTFNYKVY